MKKFFSLIAVALVAFAAQATEWTAADGNENVEYAPVYGYNFETDQHNQMQYPAAELTGLAAGTEITALKFYTNTVSQVNELGGTVVVSLANIDDVTPWSPDAWGGISGDLLDVAVTAVATVTPAADEFSLAVLMATLAARRAILSCPRLPSSMMAVRVVRQLKWLSCPRLTLWKTMLSLPLTATPLLLSSMVTSCSFATRAASARFAVLLMAPLLAVKC